MESALPPPPASRMQQRGDRLIVHFRSRRSSWFEIGFLTFWLICWTFGGVAVLIALVVADSDWPGRAFMLLWLCMWALAERAVSVMIAWQLFGREVLTITPQYLEVRREVGPIARAKRHAVGLVHDVSAVRVPTDEGESAREDFCLRFSYGGEAVHVGERMDEREAEDVASTIRSRIRPRAW